MTDPSTSPSPERPPSPDAPSVLDRLIRSLTLAVLIAAIISLLLYSLHWVLNLTIHMQAHLLAAAIILGVVHLIRFNRPWAAACLMLAIALSASVRPWEFWFAAPGKAIGRATSGQQTFRLMFWNVQQGGVDGETLTEMVAEHDVDVVAVLELDVRLQAELDDLRTAYPVHAEIPRNDLFGVGVYSRIPGVIARRRLNDQVDLMILRTAPDVGPWVDIWAVHTHPPFSRSKYRSRNIQILELAQRVAVDRSVPQIVGGDFNATTWSLPFRGFLNATGLGDSSRGFGYQATWPRFLGPFGIPIDHVAVDKRLNVISHQVLRTSDASDHAAILVTLETG